MLSPFLKFVKIQSTGSVVAPLDETSTLHSAPKTPKFGKNWVAHETNLDIDHHWTQIEKHNEAAEKIERSRKFNNLATNSPEFKELSKKLSGHMEWSSAHHKMVEFLDKRTPPKIKLEDIK